MYLPAKPIVVMNSVDIEHYRHNTFDRKIEGRIESFLSVRNWSHVDSSHA